MKKNKETMRTGFFILDPNMTDRIRRLWDPLLNNTLDPYTEYQGAHAGRRARSAGAFPLTYSDLAS